MSLFIGKDNNNKNLIHITKTTKAVTELQSPTPIADTVFHSNSKMLKCTYLGTATGVDVTYSTGECAQVVTFPLSYSPLSTTGIANNNYMFFIILKDGVYSVWSGLHVTEEYLYTAIENMFNSTVPNKIGLLHRPKTGATTYNDEINILYPYSITTQRASLPSEKITVWAYKLEEFTPNSDGGITVGTDTIQIGTDDLKNISFLNVTQINTIDKTWPGLPFQLLNSSDTLTSIGINQKSIGTYDTNGNFYPIFGEGLANNTVLKEETLSESIDYTTPLRVHAPPGSLCILKDLRIIVLSGGVETVSNIRVNATINVDYIYSGQQIYIELCNNIQQYTDFVGGYYYHIKVVSTGIDYFDLESVVLETDINGTTAYELSSRLACTAALYY